jgi:hypothetical protein
VAADRLHRAAQHAELGALDVDLDQRRHVVGRQLAVETLDAHADLLGLVPLRVVTLAQAAVGRVVLDDDEAGLLGRGVPDRRVVDLDAREQLA